MAKDDEMKPHSGVRTIRPYEDDDASDYHVCYLRGVVDGEGNFMCCGHMLRLSPRARKSLFVRYEDDEAAPFQRHLVACDGR